MAFLGPRRLFQGLAVLVVLCLLVLCFLPRGTTEADDTMRLPDPSDPHVPRYTVILNTYKRNDLLAVTAAHYAQCPSVDVVRVVWSEVGVAPPPLGIPKVEFDVHTTNSLNNRFIPSPRIRTDAIFSVDDDVRVPCLDVENAFRTWRGSTRSLVGFVPRLAYWSGGRFVYSRWWDVWLQGAYNIILPTKCAFFHKRYLNEYTHHMNASVREHVDKHFNCEDIALNFLIANITSLPPIWVKGRVEELGSTGLSSRKQHEEDRHACINRFVEIFLRNPLVRSHVKIVRIKDSWTW